MLQKRRDSKNTFHLNILLECLTFHGINSMVHFYFNTDSNEEVVPNDERSHQMMYTEDQ